MWLAHLQPRTFYWVIAPLFTPWAALVGVASHLPSLPAHRGLPSTESPAADDSCGVWTPSPCPSSPQHPTDRKLVLI
ncbi:hypothetical protein E2C01_067284 [Portunus trituberculatus]|uniref:Uncharacterized protein n=1 Tax=Portunus trituberculatus TaxID=210409 RepID=A0A5B7HW97_PORTR|nr:hypothetical protein [Portunus trituberculatus]